MKKKWLLGLALTFILVLAACGGDDDGDGGSEDASEETSDEVGEVAIGYSGPLSGPAAYYGDNTLHGLQIAADEINEAGGFEVDGQQYEINLVTLDDEYLPNETAANAKRLVQENDAKIIYNPHSGGIYAMQVFNEQDDFLIAAYTSEPGVLEQDNDLTWRLPPSYESYIEPFSDYQMDRFGDKIAFLPTNSQFGKDWAEMLKPVWEEKGGEVVYEVEIDFAKDTDFYTPVTNALEQDPDVLFIGGPSEPTALLAKQARDLGFEGGFLVMDQAKLDEMAEIFEGDMSALEGSTGVLPLVNSEFPGTDQFVETYNELHDKNPGSEAGFHYVTLFGYIEAMKIAGTVDDIHAIRDALDEGIQNVPEENQVYTIDGVSEDGANQSPFRMAVVEDGEVIEVTIDELNE